MALEDLAAIGVVANDRQDEDDEHEGIVNWSLVGDDGVITAGVFDAFLQSGGGWHETWVYTSTSPPERGEEDDSTLGEPTLRVTPDPGLDEEEHEAVRQCWQCWQCGRELVWTDEQHSRVCSRCDPVANLFKEDEAVP
jgi:hypothetical protein